MPRPRKCRKVCCLPLSNQFGPLDESFHGAGFVTMTVDEYESIRLIDWETLTQEQCAAHMNIARTTVQGIYDGARRKIAEALVFQKILRIEGGDYELHHGQGTAKCSVDNCCKRLKMMDE